MSGVLASEKAGIEQRAKNETLRLVKELSATRIALTDEEVNECVNGVSAIPPKEISFTFFDESASLNLVVKPVKVRISRVANGRLNAAVSKMQSPSGSVLAPPRP